MDWYNTGSPIYTRGLDATRQTFTCFAQKNLKKRVSGREAFGTYLKHMLVQIHRCYIPVQESYKINISKRRLGELSIIVQLLDIFYHNRGVIT